MPLSAVFINIFDNNEYYPRISVTRVAEYIELYHWVSVPILGLIPGSQD